jgi:glycosyltransferase involved in cell wall biosynthesis
MRILVLAPQEFYADRGTPIAVDLLVRALSAQGHEVDVLAYHLGSTPGYPNVTVHRMPRIPFIRSVPPGLSGKKLVCDVAFFAAMLGLLARRRFDVVHAVEESVFMAMVARALFGVPYVYDMDSSLSQQVLARLPALRPIAGALRLAEGLAVRYSDAVAPVCDALARMAEAHQPRRVVMLRDVSLLGRKPDGEGAIGRGADVRAELGPRAGTGPVAMYVGSLERYQGIDLLLEAFALAARRVPALTLAIVGGRSQDITRYERLAVRLGVGARVRFLGPRPVERLGDYLAAADVLVSPRIRGENTPMKLYSYLHAGKAVLATDLPTHTQVLGSDVALLVAARPEALADGLVRLGEDPGLRARLGAAGRRLIEERHNPAAFAAQVAALYGRRDALDAAASAVSAGA